MKNSKMTFSTETMNIDFVKKWKIIPGALSAAVTSKANAQPPARNNQKKYKPRAKKAAMSSVVSVSN